MPLAIHHVAITASALTTFRPLRARFSATRFSPIKQHHHPCCQFRRLIYPLVKISCRRLDFERNSCSSATRVSPTPGVIRFRYWQLITFMINYAILELLRICWYKFHGRYTFHIFFHKSMKSLQDFLNWII